MDSKTIRSKFVNYFSKNGHKKVESSPIIPQNDPTLLFANAGMNQFKDIFTGKNNPQNKKAVSIQKCVRAGGKHNDLENVGMTSRHHTFFEMLGNFSFGDYFKKEAIEFAWKLLVEEYKIPENKLYVTVHHSDDEAKEIWKNHIGLSDSKIFKKGDKDNFWEMGEVGPCGPCSEIFYDYGPDYSTPNFKPGKGQDILDDEMRYIEIWNLVFMQFEKTGKETIPLPKPSIDTGAGLERIAACLQGKYWNYDTDLFMPIIHKLEKLSGKSYGQKESADSMRVIADHIRATSMMITDGVLPSNEGRGYVLRRIIRRAVRHLRELGLKDLSFYKLVPTVFDILGNEYPQNKANQSLAEKILKGEEEKFLETLDNGLKFLETSLKNDLKGKVFSGESAFKLYDTFGFPYDLTQVILQEKGISINENEFDHAMKEAKERSKKSWKTGVSVDQSVYYDLHKKYGDTEFTGYENLSTEAKLLEVKEVEDSQLLIFDKSPFYAEGGGQVGDQGSIYDGKTLVAEILDTKKPVSSQHIHFAKTTNKLEPGKTYSLEVSKSSRSQTTNNHSATHLLQAALIAVLGDHVKQSGSEVNEHKLRFDFTHMKGLSKEELEKVESLVNEQIQNALNVEIDYMSKDKAIQKGAQALFGEKYGDEVRVLSMSDFSIELCGGTHVKNVSEIGSFIILSESALSSGVRRIEALTGVNAFKFLKKRNAFLKEIESLTKTKDTDAVTRVKELKDDLKLKKKEIENLNLEIQNQKAKSLFSNPEKINDISLIVAQVEKGVNLRSLSDQYIDKSPNTVMFLTSNNGDKINALIRSSKGLEIDCSKLLKEFLEKLNGRGGGKKNMAQGSGDNLEEVSKFIDETVESIRSTFNDA